jgi:hypothetical protein
MAASIHTVMTRRVSKHEWASQTGRGLLISMRRGAHTWGCRRVAECVHVFVSPCPRRPIGACHRT